MSRSKAGLAPPSLGRKGRVLDAAERLLGDGTAEFSMRDLAAEAGVSFATPFNQFGSKLAIMRALSAERIELMHARSAAALQSADAVERVLAVVAIAAAVMTEKPAVNRAVMAAIGAPGSEPADIRGRSRALWTAALGDAAGLSPARRDLGLTVLPDLLALAFRGVLSFWTAGEIRDEDLCAEALSAAGALLFGFVGEAQRTQLADLMRATSH